MATTTKKVRGALSIRKELINAKFNGEEDKILYKWMPNRGGVIKGSELVAYATKAAHVPEATLLMAADALFDAISYFCLQGHSVQVPNLGTFGLQMNSKCVPAEEDVTAETITRKYIRFWPKKEVREQCNLQNINLKVVE